MENVVLNEAGVPTVSYRRRSPTAESTAFMTSSRRHPQPSDGVAWNGFSSWLHRPLVTTEVPGRLRGGALLARRPGPSQVVLSAALAAYGCHDYLKATVPEHRATAGVNFGYPDNFRILRCLFP